MNQFSEKYKLKTNLELIGIINNPGEYQVLAIEAAKEELSARGVTQAEINETEISVNNKEKAESLSTTTFDKVNSYIRKNPLEENIILGLSILVGLWAIINFSEMLRVLNHTIRDISHFDFSTVIFMLIVLIPPIAAILFWKRKKLGWILLAILLTHSIIKSIAKFLNSFLHGRLDLIIHMGTAALLVYFLYLISKPQVRKIYTVEKNIISYVIGLTTSVMILVYIYFLI